MLVLAEELGEVVGAEVKVRGHVLHAGVVVLALVNPVFDVLGHRRAAFAPVRGLIQNLVKQGAHQAVHRVGGEVVAPRAFQQLGMQTADEVGAPQRKVLGEGGLAGPLEQRIEKGDGPAGGAVAAPLVAAFQQQAFAAAHIVAHAVFLKIKHALGYENQIVAGVKAPRAVLPQGVVAVYNAAVIKGIALHFSHADPLLSDRFL